MARIRTLRNGRKRNGERDSRADRYYWNKEEIEIDELGELNLMEDSKELEKQEKRTQIFLKKL